MRKILMLSFLAVSLTITSHAQETKPKKESKVIEASAKSEKNAEVAKLKEATNNKKSAAVTKDKNSGPVYGPDYCDVVVDNYTNLYIKIWVDGEYKGLVAPYGKVTVAAIPGRTKLYCRADFDDGSYKWWGPEYFQCDYEYTWRLRN